MLWLALIFITEITDYQQSYLESEVLQRNYSILYQAISADDIVPSLFTNKLITSAEMEKINSESSGGAKNTVLLTALRRRPRPFHQFCEILSTTPGQEDLAKLLLRGKALLSLYSMTLCAYYIRSNPSSYARISFELSYAPLMQCLSTKEYFNVKAS